jgi:hypothetical protein
MKYVFGFLFFLNCGVAGLNAQVNLVPNFSFEQYDTCPYSQDQIQFASGWSKYSSTASTPDYYNACAPPDTSFGVPKSRFNNQEAHRNCNAYSGLITWGAAGNDREYIGIQLSQPLIVGQKYFLSFYTVMTESYLAGTYFGMPANNIGMRLSTVDYDPSAPAPINNFAHVFSSSVISDSVNWVRISGSIIADSAYAYLALGNFFDDANTDTFQYSCASCLNVQAYYLVDDVCVSTDSVLANGGIDALPCTTSIYELAPNEGISVFPNPVEDIITLSLQNFQCDEITLTDASGRIVHVQWIVSGNSATIDMSSCPSGMYFLNINLSEGERIISQKVVKL